MSPAGDESGDESGVSPAGDESAVDESASDVMSPAGDQPEDVVSLAGEANGPTFKVGDSFRTFEEERASI